MMHLLFVALIVGAPAAGQSCERLIRLGAWTGGTFGAVALSFYSFYLNDGVQTGLETSVPGATIGALLGAGIGGILQRRQDARKESTNSQAEDTSPVEVSLDSVEAFWSKFNQITRRVFSENPQECLPAVRELLAHAGQFPSKKSGWGLIEPGSDTLIFLDFVMGDVLGDLQDREKAATNEEDKGIYREAIDLTRQFSARDGGAFIEGCRELEHKVILFMHSQTEAWLNGEPFPKLPEATLRLSTQQAEAVLGVLIEGKDLLKDTALAFCTEKDRFEQTIKALHGEDPDLNALVRLRTAQIAERLRELGTSGSSPRQAYQSMELWRRIEEVLGDDTRQ